jgi:hypothetical protein
MAEFYGVLKGNRGETTRCGSKKSGIRCDLLSWKGKVVLTMENIDGEIWVTCFTGTSKSGRGNYNSVFRKKLSELMEGDFE